jgi:hypothetical protein
MLALITNMQGQVSPISVNEVDQVLFASTSPFQGYYKRQSYNKAWFTGKTYAISLDRPAGAGCDSGVSLYNTDVQTAIKSQGINLRDYDRVLFVPPVGYCSFVGKSPIEINGIAYKLSQSWVSWYSLRNAFDANALDNTLAHEIGHALGVMHANFLLCDHDDCSHQEYGNYFDIMGGGIGHFNAFYKEQLGWLTNADFTNITRTGTFSMRNLDTLYQLESRGAKIVNPLIGSSSVLYLEKRGSIRGPSEFASNQADKLLLNMPQHPFDLTHSDVWLIDMKPGVPAGDVYTDSQNVSLGVGEQYSMPSYGVTIGPVRSVSTSTIEFNVDMHAPVCTHAIPLTVVQNSDLTTSPGGAGYVYISVTNNDSVCNPPSTFALTFNNLPSGWSINTEQSKLSVSGLQARATDSLWAAISVPEAAVPGKYTLSFSVTNTAGGLSKTSDTSIIVEPRPQIISIEPTAGVRNSSVTVHTNISNNRAYTYLDFVGPSRFIPFSGNVGTNGDISMIIPTTYDNGTGSKSDTSSSAIIPVLPGSYDVILNTYGGQSQPYRFTILATSTPTISSILLVGKDDTTYMVGSTMTIKWQSSGVSRMNIDLYDYKGIRKVRTIGTIDASQGYYEWKIPGDIDFNFDTVYVIRISDASQPKLYKNSRKIEIVPDVVR